MILYSESNVGKINLSCDTDSAPHEFMPLVPINGYWDGHTSYTLVIGIYAGAGGTETMAKIWKIYRVQAADPSPAMSWTRCGCSNSEMLPVGLPLNISNVTWLMNSGWVHELYSLDFTHYCGLKGDHYLLTKEQRSTF